MVGSQVVENFLGLNASAGIGLNGIVGWNHFLPQPAFNCRIPFLERLNPARMTSLPEV
jgi:hypothetical protein